MKSGHLRRVAKMILDLKVKEERVSESRVLLIKWFVTEIPKKSLDTFWHSVSDSMEVFMSTVV